MRQDYLKSAAKHAGQPESAGPLLVPEIPTHRNLACGSGKGRAIVTREMLGTRWPSLFGGQLMFLVETVAHCAALEWGVCAQVPILRRLSYTFMKPVRKESVGDTPGEIVWCTTVRPEIVVCRDPIVKELSIAISLDYNGERLGEGTADFYLIPTPGEGGLDEYERIARFIQGLPKDLILPALDCVSEGDATGVWETAAPLSAIADSALAAAMRVIRGDNVPDDLDQRYVVYAYDVRFCTPERVAPGKFVSSVRHIGNGPKTLATAFGTLMSLDGKPLATTTGILSVTQTPMGPS